ncbi:MAG: hypothetical protein IAE99_07865 [Rhodothermales bacterium]|nr:hypothetical protein [Rhodothermales bacterium]
MATNALTVVLDLDADGVVRGLKSATGETIRFEKATEQAGKQSERFGRILDFSLGQLAANAAQRLFDNVRGLISQGIDLVASSGSIAEAQSKYNAVFGESSDEVQAYIDKTAPLLGLSSSQAQGLLSTTGAILQGAGYTQEASATTSQAIMTMAGDLAMFNDREPAEVFHAITSAITGEREQLKSLGIVIGEADVQQKAFAMTGKRSADALTDQEKAAATLTLITEKMGVAVGAMGREAETAAGQKRQLTAQMASLAEAAQKELAPAAADVTAKLLEIAQSEEVMDTVRAAAARLADLIMQAAKAAMWAAGVFIEHKDTIGDVAEVVGILAVAVGAYIAVQKVGAAWSAITKTSLIGEALAREIVTAWTNRQSVAQGALAVATKVLNAAMKANPIGFVIAAVILATGLIYKFRVQILSAAATFSDWLASLAAAIPGLDALAKMLGLDSGVSGALRSAADAARKSAAGMREQQAAGEGAAAATGGLTSTTEENTDTTDTNTDSHERGAKAKRDHKKATDQFKGALASAREEVEKLTRQLRDLEAASAEGAPREALVALLRKAADAKREIDAIQESLDREANPTKYRQADFDELEQAQAIADERRQMEGVTESQILQERLNRLEAEQRAEGLSAEWVMELARRVDKARIDLDKARMAEGVAAKQQQAEREQAIAEHEQAMDAERHAARLDALRDEHDAALSAMDAEIERARLSGDLARAGRLEAARSRAAIQYTLDERLAAAREAHRAAVAEAASMDTVEARRAVARAELALKNETEAAKRQAAMQTAALERRLDAERLERQKQAITAALSYAQEFTTQVGALMGAQHQARIAEIETEEAREMERFDAQLKRIDEALQAENLSADERAALEIRKQQLTRDREAAEKKYEQEKATRNREQAERERLVTLAQIAIQTALNVVKAFPNVAAMVGAGVLGAMQAAVVMATPIPRNLGGWVPGTGPDRDSTLMYLTPGEAVINRRSAQANAYLIDSMNRFPGVRLPTGVEQLGGVTPQAAQSLTRGDLDYLADKITAGVAEAVKGRVVVPVISDRDVYDAADRHGDIVKRNTVRFGGGS